MKNAFVSLLCMTVVLVQHARYSTSVNFIRPGNVGTHIINGQEASQGQFPFVVAVMYNDTIQNWYHQACAATLIRDRWMLTTGGCTPYMFFFAALPGLYDLTEVNATTPRRIGIQKFIYSTLVSDLILLRLDEPIDPGNPFTQPIEYAPESGDDFVGASCWTMGWGERFAGDPEGAGVLRYIETKVISQSECEERTGYDMSHSICAFTGYSGPCGRDVGGPLICTRGEKTYLVGVLSSFDRSCYPTVPAIYTRVSLFTLWLEDRMDNN